MAIIAFHKIWDKKNHRGLLHLCSQLLEVKEKSCIRTAGISRTTGMRKLIVPDVPVYKDSWLTWKFIKTSNQRRVTEAYTVYMSTNFFFLLLPYLVDSTDYDEKIGIAGYRRLKCKLYFAYCWIYYKVRWSASQLITSKTSQVGQHYKCW